MTNSQDMYRHFLTTASNYRQVRTTDPEIIQFIADSLKDKTDLKVADIGCGAGRYDLLLFQALENLHLTCIDMNENMLEQASVYLKDNGIHNFAVIQSDADNIPLARQSMDAILTFNAVHHFNFANFIQQCGSALKADGRIFIYTRLRSQNAKSVWGQYFPDFTEKEDRLYELNEMEAAIQASEGLGVETIKRFEFQRSSSLERLTQQAQAKHYSTFSLYTDSAFNEALSIFQDKVRQDFPDQGPVEWVDANILLVLKVL